MGFDTMKAFQRLMLSEHLHDGAEDIKDFDYDHERYNQLAVKRQDSCHSDGQRRRCGVWDNDISSDIEIGKLTAKRLSKPPALPISAAPVSAPSFQETTSGWSPPTSPRSNSPRSSILQSPTEMGTQVESQLPVSLPTSIKEKNALANKLFTAACAGDLETIELLLSLGVPVDSSTFVPGLFDAFKPAKPGHLSPLAGAASHGQADVVELLLANGATLNPKCTQSASSPLHQACHTNDIEIVRLLLEVGANVNIPNRYNTTPLMYAVKYASPSLVSLVLEYGPDMSKLSFIGAAAIHWSIWPCNPDITELLLRAGANPNLPMLDGNTALHCASLTGSIEMVKCLLKYGADPFMRNSEHQTPLQTAKDAEANEIAELLKAAMFLLR